MLMFNRIRLAAILAFFAIPACTDAKTIRVRSQEDFDNLSRRVATVASTSPSSRLRIVFKSGTYVADDGQVLFSAIDRPDLKIRILGRSSVIIPRGREYRNGDRYDGVFDVNRSWMSSGVDVPIWSEVKYADGKVEVLDAENKQCRLKSTAPVPDIADTSDAYISIPHWYRSSIYKIDKIQDSYIYFTAPDLALSYNNGYNVNDDLNYGKKPIRYKLCNVGGEQGCFRIEDGMVRLPSGVSSVWEGDAYRFLEVRNCKLKSFELTGFEFRGSKYRDYAAPAVYFVRTDFGSALISNCTFSGLRSQAVAVSASSNVTVKNCVFQDCYLGGVTSENRSLNTHVAENTFRSMGKRMENTFCVICRGENYRVSDNTMTDFGYGGIGVGVWYKHDKPAPCNGVVERNTLTFTPQYSASIDQHGIMDSGAIYVWTQNDGAVIRDNVIDGYSGMKDNRGIFCDDGAYNVTISGNTITGIANSYSIDSRRVQSVESAQGSKVRRANVNNRVSGNVVDAPIRFEPREGSDNGCHISGNIEKSR